MIDLFTKKRASSVLALNLEGGRIEAAVVRRTNGSVKIQHAFAAPLSVQPLSTEAELIGRDIRNHLDRAGIRERRCAVCLPCAWVLTVTVKVPDLPEADVQSLLDIEAERGFPYAPEALSIVRSDYRSPDGERYVTLLAVPRNNLSQLERALKAAELSPTSFSLGIAAIQPPGHSASDGVLTLAVGENSVDLQVTVGGGVAALRSIEGAIETEGAQKRLSADGAAREIRITLGQMPPEFRKTVRTVRVIGRGEVVQQFVGELTPLMEAKGMTVETLSAYSNGEGFPKGTEISQPASMGAMLLRRSPVFEFRPPKAGPLQQMLAKASSKKLVTATAAAAGLAILVGGAFGYQQWRLSGLEKQWTAMAPAVRDLEAQQRNIRQFRPWFDDSFRSLVILRQVTEAFPEDGRVSARTIDVRDLARVTCSGTANDHPAFLKMLEQLRATREVSNLQVDQMRGTPTQFTFNFQWAGGGHEP